MGAGLFTPAHAAETVPFEPTVSVEVSPSSQLGEEVPIKVTLGAAAGTEWADTGDTPVSVRVEAQGESKPMPPEGGNNIGTTAETKMDWFQADHGAGEYTFTMANAEYKKNWDYTFVVSVLKEDGNTEYITTDASTDPDSPTAKTEVTFSPRVVGTIDSASLTADGETFSNLKGTGFNGTTLDVTSTLYGPFDTRPTETASVPPGATVVGSTLNSYSGGDAQTSAEKVTSPGFYVWHHTIAAGAESPAFTPAFAAEGTVVEVKAAAVTPTVPRVAPSPAPSDGPSTDSTITPKEAPLYKNCAAVEAAGVGPLTPADTGYGTHLDEDEDGVACESARRAEGDVDASISVGVGTAFKNCTEAIAAGYSNIKSTDPMYVADQDRDKDNIACEDDGSDAAVAIDGGFAQAASSDKAPFFAGGVALILLSLALAASALVRRNKTVK